MIKKLIISILTNLSIFFNKIVIKLTRNKNLTINSITHNDTGRYYQYILSNNNLLSHKAVLRGIYNTLMIMKHS